jgi:hypothetical protein
MESTSIQNTCFSIYCLGIYLSSVKHIFITYAAVLQWQYHTWTDKVHTLLNSYWPDKLIREFEHIKW